MKLFLEELPHQEEALKAIMDAFPKIDDCSTDPDINYVYANPLLYGRYDEKKFLDVKMETGTGKTYVYTRLLYELHKERGLFKFIIVVPSPAIKEGTKHFIQSDYAKQHFSQHYGNVRIDLNVINAGDFKVKSGRKNFPAQLTSFIEGSRLNSNTIQVLLVNADMLRSSSMTSDKYDQTLLSNITQPIAALERTRPVVIIDEPHRFPIDGKNYQAVTSLKPQMIVRFGATFPEVMVKNGRVGHLKKHYYQDQPVYNLTAVKSFNQGLVKGIDIAYPKLTKEESQNIWKVVGVKAKELTLKKGNFTRTLTVGDNLADVDSAFEGDVFYAGSKVLSNGLELAVGMMLMPHTFANSYQELMIEDAIDKHFIKEWELFSRPNNQPKIKALTLFFIDSIASYRKKDGWLRLTFERLLLAKLQSRIADMEKMSDAISKDYLGYLKASLCDLQADTQSIHAGYFGEDRGSSADDIQAEVDDILHNKTKLLSFKDGEGNWLTRRFLFSKWTLREGWDNPNVFVICKLRTSGSENSKIQEVGRGLRLPVDEKGRRVTQDEFVSRLDFLIGYDERDFAQKLIGEINNDAPIEFNRERLDEQTIRLILSHYSDLTENVLKNQLGQKGIIDFSMTYQEGGWDRLCQLYPILTEQQLRGDKVRNSNETRPVTHVKLNQDNWEQVKELWRDFSKRRMIVFDDGAVDISKLMDQIFLDETHYVVEYFGMIRESLVAGGSEVASSMETDRYSHTRAGMAYGDFLKKLVQETNLPITALHRRLLKVLKKIRNDNILNNETLKNLVKAFKCAFEKSYSTAYRYESLDFQAITTLYDATTDSFVNEIIIGNLGTKELTEVGREERYLYDRPPVYYDSENPEKKLLQHHYDKTVTVFGKLPKSAIRIPKYMGGTTSPDFVFVIEGAQNKIIYLFVETKADNMRDTDKLAIAIQEYFFNSLGNQNIVYQVATDEEQVYQKLRELGTKQ